jgi:NitT/TauT family transport system substrate-binding protein
MTRRSLLKGAAALSAGAAVPWIAGCGGDDDSTPASKATSTPAGSASGATAPTATATTAPSPTVSTRDVSITLQTGWYAQVESSAVLAGVVYNTFPPNLHVTVKDGGPGSTPTTLVAVGQLDMATVAADGLLFARDQGLPIKAIMSPLAVNPTALASHKELGIKSFADMKGHKVAISKGSSYGDYLKKKYAWSDSDQATYNGSLAVWLTDKNLITQLFATNEAYGIQQQNIPYDLFLLKDAGYDAPMNMIGVNEKFLEKNADVMPAFIKGVQDGIAKAISDPMPLYKEITKRSPTTTMGNMAFSWTESLKLMNTPYSLEHGFGMIDPAQMTGLFSSLKDLGLFKTDFKVEDAYTNQFVPPTVVKAA